MSSVYIEHTDAYGVVFYANYFATLANAAEALGTADGGAADGDAAKAMGRGRVLAIDECKYARPAVLGDEIAVRSEVMEVVSTSGSERRAVVRQIARNANDEETVYLSADVTYVDRDDASEAFTSVETPEWTPEERFATTPVRVYRGEASWGEDELSHVDVLRFFERGRTDAIGGARALQHLKETHGVVVVVSRLNARFAERMLVRRRPNAIPECEVRSCVEFKSRGIQIVFHQALYDVDGVTCVARASIACTCLNSKTMRPMKCPSALAEQFTPFVLRPSVRATGSSPESRITARTS